MVTTNVVTRWNKDKEDFEPRVTITPELSTTGAPRVTLVVEAGELELLTWEAEHLAKELRQAARRAEAIAEAYQNPSTFLTPGSLKRSRRGRKRA